MSKPMKVLRTVTDRFNIFKDGRRLAANRRNYVLAAVRQTFESPQTQELLRLGEAYGYYGHQPRARAGKLSIGESEVIIINGKPIVVENVPGCRTLSITIDDEGTVTHTQEILDTPTGQIMLSLIDSRVGGWSWVTGGRDMAHASVPRSYYGMDYVLQPNYLSLDHPEMMLEGVENREDMILESLQKNGLDEAGARAALKYLNGNTAAMPDMLAEREQECMMLEAMLADKETQLSELEDLKCAMSNRSTMMMEAVSSAPVYITDEQRNALVRMETVDDMKAVQAMFESLGHASSKLTTLPHAYEPAYIGGKQSAKVRHNDIVDFSPTRRFS